MFIQFSKTEILPRDLNVLIVVKLLFIAKTKMEIQLHSASYKASFKLECIKEFLRADYYISDLIPGDVFYKVFLIYKCQNQLDYFAKVFLENDPGTSIAHHSANLKFNIRPYTKKEQSDNFKNHNIKSTVMYVFV